MKRVAFALAGTVSVLVLVLSALALTLSWQVASQVSTTPLRIDDASSPPAVPTRSAPPASASPSPDAAGPAGEALDVLLVGSDTRKGTGNSQYGSPDSFGDPRADVAIVAHISADRSWGYLMSIPRDLVVDIPTESKACGSLGYTERARFNESLSRGGVPCVVATLESVLPGLRLDHAVVVDFEGFTATVDALGGLEICLKGPIVDSSASADLPAGQQTLSGRDALALVRARKSLADGSDIARTERQQVVARAFARQLSESVSLSGAQGLYTAARAVAPHLTVDDNLSSLSSLVSLGRSALEAFSSDFHSRTLPWMPDPQSPRETVVLDIAGWEKMSGVFLDDKKPKRARSRGYSDPYSTFCR